MPMCTAGSRTAGCSGAMRRFGRCSAACRSRNTCSRTQTSDMLRQFWGSLACEIYSRHESCSLCNRAGSAQSRQFEKSEGPQSNELPAGYYLLREYNEGGGSEGPPEQSATSDLQTQQGGIPRSKNSSPTKGRNTCSSSLRHLASGPSDGRVACKRQSYC